MAGPSESIPRVIALIDLPDLEWQVRRLGSVSGNEVEAVLRLVENDLVDLDPGRTGAPLSLGLVHLYSPPAVDRFPEDARVVRKQLGAAVNSTCSGCHKACTHCQEGTKDPGGRGHDNPLAVDLMELARRDAYDWAVIICADTWLTPVVRYIQAHGRKIIHGCFPPIAMDLTRECWASIDLRPLISQSCD